MATTAVSKLSSARAKSFKDPKVKQLQAKVAALESTLESVREELAQTETDSREHYASFRKAVEETAVLSRQIDDLVKAASEFEHQRVTLIRALGMSQRIAAIERAEANKLREELRKVEEHTSLLHRQLNEYVDQVGTLARRKHGR